MCMNFRSCLRVALSFLIALANAGALAQQTEAGRPGPGVSEVADNAQRFDILEFQIEGNTVLPVAAIERAVTPFLGEGKRMDAVDAAREALEKAYQTSGYLTVFVDVPEQRVDGGVVVLKVTEGRVARLKVSGSRYYSQGYIRERVAELDEGKVPNFNVVQQQLALVNNTDARRVQPVMRAGLTPGTVETELKVEDRLPLGGSIELNNRAAANTTPLRLTATAHYDNLFQLDHSISLSLSTAPAKSSESRVASLNYSIPGQAQSAWVGYYIYSDSSVAAIGDVNVLGKGTTVGWRYIRPLASTAEASHSLSVGFDYKDLKQDTVSGANTISTPLKYLPLQMAYNGTIDEGTWGQTQLTVSATTALRRIFQRDVDCPGGTADQFACQRQGGDGGFASLRGDWRQMLPIGAAGSLRFRFNGQVSTGPLPSAEQFTIGGSETVRGYYEAEAAGDGGLLFSMEWRSPDLAARLSRLMQSDSAQSTPPLWSQTVALAFVDAARAYLYDPATGQAPHVSLASFGVGSRLKVRKSVTGEVDLAWPVKETIYTRAHSPRADFKLLVDF